MGVHLDPAVVTVVLLDLAGAVVARRLIPVGSPEPGRIIDEMARAIDALITEEVAFADVAAELPRLFAPGASGLATVVRYE